MAKITTENRELFKEKSGPYKQRIDELLKKEKEMLLLIQRDKVGVAYKKLLLSEQMLEIATLYMTINSLSVEILETKNNDALNDARKILYKSIIYLEDIVTNTVDVQYSEIEDKVEQIANTPLEKRFYLTRKMGLAIRLLIDAFGENTKWKWSFVELNGRFAVVAKNMLNMREAGKTFFDPNLPDYENTVKYIRLLKKLLDQTATGYRDRYELSTHRIDDMRLAINFISAARRICVMTNEREEAEELKKKAIVWRERLTSDQKSGHAN